jgi:predicted phage gp36 major capsid-like protein
LRLVALIILLVASLPSATLPAMGDARDHAHRYVDRDARAFDQAAGDEDPSALPDAGSDAEVPGPAVHGGLPSWTLRIDASERLRTTALRAPVTSARARRGHTVPRRCAPRQRDDADGH